MFVCRLGISIFLCLCLHLCLHLLVSECVGCMCQALGMDLYLCVCVHVCIECDPSSLLSPQPDSLFLLPFLSVVHASLISVGLLSRAASSFPASLYFSVHPPSSSQALTIQPGGCGNPVTICHTTRCHNHWARPHLLGTVIRMG